VTATLMKKLKFLILGVVPSEVVTPIE